jgi:hypothetical protein
MKVVEKIVEISEEVIEYVENTVKDGDYIEAYVGRCHLEGTVLCKDGTFFRLDSDHDMIGMVEFELEKVIDDLIELVHIDTENNVKTIIRLF